MKIKATATDNVTELLVKILEFTRTRRHIITENINNAKKPGFVPRDLPIEEFSKTLHVAVDEHVNNGRLVFQDSDNIRFGFAGSIELKPVTDHYAKDLFETNMDEYLEFQVNKLLENSMNEKLAAELVKQKNGAQFFLE